MSGGAEGERFLIAFSSLREAVGDSPAVLSDRKEDEALAALCDELAALVRSFELVEERSRSTFTPNVSSAGTLARRDYDERWRAIVTDIANRDLNAWFAEFFPTELEDTTSVEVPADPLGEQIDRWKQEAREAVRNIEQLPDFAHSHYEIDQGSYLDWVPDSLDAWQRLVNAGLDIEGVLWRRSAIPHVLVPAHVAKHYGQHRASLYRRLHQAGQAFTFGVPLAAVALQRAVLEEVLKTHWGAERLSDADLPQLSWGSRASRIQRLGNEALHRDPEMLKGDDLDRSIIENFLVLRLLIENAPLELRKER